MYPRIPWELFADSWGPAEQNFGTAVLAFIRVIFLGHLKYVSSFGIKSHPSLPGTCHVQISSQSSDVLLLDTSLAQYIHCVHCETLVFRDMTPCCLVENHQRFGGMYCCHLQCRRLTQRRNLNNKIVTSKKTACPWMTAQITSIDVYLLWLIYSRSYTFGNVQHKATARKGDFQKETGQIFC